MCAWWILERLLRACEVSCFDLAALVQPRLNIFCLFVGCLHFCVTKPGFSDAQVKYYVLREA